jgi:hypothetical protein
MTEFVTVKMLCNWDSGDGLCRTWDKLTDGNCTYTKDNASIKMVGDGTPTDDADYVLVVDSAKQFYPSLSELPRTIFLKMEPGPRSYTAVITTTPTTTTSSGTSTKPKTSC